MRSTAPRAVVASVVVVLLLLGSTVLLALLGASPVALAPRTAGPVEPSRGATAPGGRMSRLVPSLLPVTAAPGLRPDASSPTSAVIETPPPQIPESTPTTFTVATDEKCSGAGGCTPHLNITAPTGPWALILLNYTGSAVSGVYDSSFHALVDSVPVLFGTTPESSTWTVLKSLDEYASLFGTTADVQFDLGEAVTSGYFLISVTVSFYPVPAGQSAPVEPTQIVPLFSFNGVTQKKPVLSVNATVPKDVENATLEVYAYGFGSGAGSDEFWYANDPPLRTVNITVGGVPLVNILPFEYINTGGLDLYLWNPVTGVYTLDNPPYRTDVTSALGLIEGTHTYNATVTGVDSVSDWTIGASLMLYENANFTGAHVVAVSAAFVTPTRGYSGANEFDRYANSYAYSSELTYGITAETVSSWTNESFYGLTLANGAGAQVSATTVSQEEFVPASGGSTEWINASSSPSATFNASEVGGTPYSCSGNECQNITYTMNYLAQNFNQTRTVTVVNATGSWPIATADSNDNVTANGWYSALVSDAGGGEEINAIYAYYANTSKVYSSVTAVGADGIWFNHTEVSQLTPSDTTGQGTLLVNAVSYSDAVALVATSLVTEGGRPNTFTATPYGYGSPFTYAWQGLPASCAPAATADQVTCATATAKLYTVSVAAISGGGKVSPEAFVPWTVVAAVVPTLSLQAAATDLGHPTNITLAYTGGAPPVTCEWSAGGYPFAGLTGCPMKVEFTPTVTGVIEIGVNLTDALGVSVLVTTNLTVVALPFVQLTYSPSSSSLVPTITVGSSLELQSVIAGGIGPFGFSWVENGASELSVGDSQNYTFTPTTSGNYTFTVSVTDADGSVSTSPVLKVEVTALPTGKKSTPGGGNSTGTSPSSSDLANDALVGAGVIGAVILLALLLLTRRRPPGASAPAAPSPPAPTTESPPGTPPPQSF